MFQLLFQENNTLWTIYTFRHSNWTNRHSTGSSSSTSGSKFEQAEVQTEQRTFKLNKFIHWVIKKQITLSLLLIFGSEIRWRVNKMLAYQSLSRRFFKAELVHDSALKNWRIFLTSHEQLDLLKSAVDGSTIQPPSFQNAWEKSKQNNWSKAVVTWSVMHE